MDATPPDSSDAAPMPGSPGTASKVARGSAWLIAARLFTKAVDLAALVVLARILSPADFGLVAVAMSLISIVEAVLELPLVTALVRLPRIEARHLDTAFTLGCLRGLLLSAILLASAWPAAIFYNDHRLTLLVAVLCIAPVVRGMSNPKLALDAKAIHFWKFFATDCAGKVGAIIVAVAVAVTLRNYWAIAIYTIASSVVGASLSFLLAPYRPRFQLSAWRDFAGYIGWNGIAQLISAVNWQFDRLFLGRMLPKAALGHYTMASDISVLPEQALIKPILSPLTSGFVRANRSEEDVRAAYLRADSAIFTIGLPIMVGMSGMASPVVRIALGDKWYSIIPYVHWLALSLIPPLASVPMGALANAINKPGAIVNRLTVEVFVRIPLILVGGLKAGVAGVIAARLLSDTIVSLASMRIVYRLIGLKVRHQLAELWKPTVAGIALYAYLYVATPWLNTVGNIPLLFGAAGVAVTGAVVYGAVLIGLWRLSGRPDGIERTLIDMLAKATRRFAPGA